jgi:hypothetical protein
VPLLIFNDYLLSICASASGKGNDIIPAAQLKKQKKKLGQQMI